MAGDGTAEYKGDGTLATSAGLYTPNGVAADASGNIYIADTSNQRIRLVTKSTGIITTVAGDGIAGYKGDGGLATSAGLSDPRSIAVDASGNIYIADANNNRIRLVTKSTGIITTVAGDGTTNFKGDGGLATLASVSYPCGVALDVSGNIYIADTIHRRIRMVTKSTGIITTVADYVMEGRRRLATSGSLGQPKGITVDALGNIYFADTQRNRICLINLKQTVESIPPSASPIQRLPSTSPAASPSSLPSSASPTASPSSLPSSASPTASPSSLPSSASQIGRAHV